MTRAKTDWRDEMQIDAASERKIETYMAELAASLAD